MICEFCFSRSVSFFLFKARKEEQIKPKGSRRKLRAEINDIKQANPRKIQ